MRTYKGKLRYAGDIHVQMIFKFVDSKWIGLSAWSIP